MISNKRPKLIVGLGNPGEEYQYTRHNVGAWFVHALARKYSSSFKAEKKFQGEIADILVNGRKIRLLFPTTYMNLSGVSIRAVCDYYDIEQEEVLVVHDELDLPVGEMRLKFSGGHGGHNGLRDTAQHIGKKFWRLRIGVDHPGNKKMVSNYLTSKKTPREDEELILTGIKKVLDDFEYLLDEGYEKTMQKWHSKPEKTKAEKVAGSKKQLSDKSKSISESKTTKNIHVAKSKTSLQLAMEKARHQEEE